MGDASLCSRCYVWSVGLVLTLQVWVMQVHTAIRENPAPQKKERSKPSETKLWKPKKLTYDERKQKLKVPLLPSLLLSVLPTAPSTLLLSVWGSGFMSNMRTTLICNLMVVTPVCTCWDIA